MWYNTVMIARKATHGEVPPLIDNDSTVLLLGSMLSPKSAAAKFYYAHPQNRFWKVLAAVFDSDEVPCGNDARAAFALENRVALWDVISVCDILGASDSTIKNVRYNDISGLLAAHPNVTRVFTTGKKAHELLMKYNATARNAIISSAVCLPSTSPQNCAVSLESLIQSYGIIKTGITERR